MATAQHNASPANIRAVILESIADWHTRTSKFAWPDDGACARPWYYNVHCCWVRAWNAEDRQTPVEEFLRKWMTDENIGAALAWDPYAA